ncbi:hypothetical protein IWQ62_001102, partial [Dispira parvispora]
MKVSILGWGALTYLLTLSPGLLANEDRVCKELREVMTAEELKPTTGLTEDTVKHQWIDFKQLSGKELLDFSPMFFLSRHKQPVEAFILIQELSDRTNK